jgi:2-dehydro-3-deoxygluconokinase
MSQDLVTFGETMLRLSPPEGERLELADELEFRVAGAESNVAVTSARLGVETTWLSKLPETRLGRKVTTSLRQHGVTTDVVWSDEGRQGTYYLEFGTEPRSTNVIYDRANAAVTTATPDELHLDQIHNAQVFFTSGITPALSSTLEATTAELLSLAQESGTTTTFDLNYRSKLWSEDTARETYESLLPDVDILVAAERDARSVLDMSGTTADIARELHASYDHEIVVLTRGSDGALATTGDDLFEQSAYETETLDPIGTGDAFVGAFLAHRIRGDTIPESLDCASATAALKRTIKGDVAAVTPQEVEALRENDEGGINR